MQPHIFLALGVLMSYDDELSHDNLLEMMSDPMKVSDLCDE